jgi:hypothetical protein
VDKKIQMTLRQKINAKISTLEDEIKQIKVEYCEAKSWTSRYTAEKKLRKKEELLNIYKELL